MMIKSKAVWKKVLFTLGLALGLVLFCKQIYDSYLYIRDSDFRIFAPFFLFLSLAANLLMYALQMCAWVLLLRYLGINLKVRAVFKGYFLSFLPRYIPGSVWGYLSRSEWLLRSHRVDYNTSALASLLEVLGLICTALSLGGGYYGFQLIATGYRWAFVGGGLLMAVFCLVLPQVLVWIMPERYRRAIDLQAFDVWLGVVTLYILFWVVYGTAVFLVGRALLPAPASSVNLMGVISAATLSWVLGFIVIFVPAGLGVREWSLERLLILAAGFDPWGSKLIAVLCRLNILIAEMSWLLIASGLYLNTQDKKSRKERLSGSKKPK